MIMSKIEVTKSLDLKIGVSLAEMLKIDIGLPAREVLKIECSISVFQLLKSLKYTLDYMLKSAENRLEFSHCFLLLLLRFTQCVIVKFL